MRYYLVRLRENQEGARGYGIHEPYLSTRREVVKVLLARPCVANVLYWSQDGCHIDIYDPTVTTGGDAGWLAMIEGLDHEEEEVRAEALRMQDPLYVLAAAMGEGQ